MASQLELTQKPFIELQIEALVTENQIKPKRVNKFVDELNKRISEIKELNYNKILSRILRLPIVGRAKLIDDDYPQNAKFVPPEKIDIIGSFLTSTAIQKRNYVDLAVCMPAEYFVSKDVKNQRYHHKRALYLAQLGYLLNGSTGLGLIERLEFRYFQSDFLKPVLIIIPKDTKLKSTTTFRLFAYPHADSPIKLSLLSSKHGNIAPRWFFKDYPFEDKEELDDGVQEFLEKDSEASASPHYNSGILFDIELISNSEILFEQVGSQVSIVEALMMTKIWLYQRELHHHFSFIISMFIAYLQTRQAVHQNMSSYQIFKVIIKSIATSDWDNAGLSYFDDSQHNISEFKTAFPVIFLSPSGNLNMCHNISLDLYHRLKHEAELAQNILATNTTEIFDHLFLKKVEFFDKFDAIVHLPKCMKKLPMTLVHLKTLMDHGIMTQRILSEKILTLSQKALSDRVSLIQQSTSDLMLDKKWGIKGIPYDPSNEDMTLTMGLLIDPEKSLRIIDVGPSADTPEAEEFRKFWEPKSQLRLQNGVISETVVWHMSSFSHRRAIIKYILDHAMKRANLRNVVVHSTLLERFIKLDNVFFQWRDEASEAEQTAAQANGPVKRKRAAEGDGTKGLKPIGVGEEIFQRVLRAYNELNKVLRGVENMTHMITTIQPVSHHLRSGAVFPPMPVSLQSKNKSLKRRRGVTMFPEDFNQTGRILHLEPVEVLLTLDSTGKWPHELEALEAAKAEYLIKMGEALKAKEYSVKFSASYLDVLHGQFVFRLRIKCQKQLTMIAASCGKVEFQRSRFELEVLPRVHAALDQLYREKPAYGLTCRLVKRWISCHLMTDHISDIALDLIVAHCFLHPQPLTEPSSSICGFRRFLKLVAQHDWKHSPLVINFDDQLKIDEANQIRDSMLENRAKFPPIVICTPYDKEASPYTRQAPTSVGLELLCSVCTKALDFVDKEILSNCEVATECKALFLPNFKMFNLIIKLNPLVVQNFYMSINQPKTFQLRGKEPGGKHASAFRVMPIVGLNLVEQYVNLLRRDYGNVALFFYDKYGQRLIGVKLKQEAEEILEGDISKLTLGIKRLGAKLVECVTAVAQEKRPLANKVNDTRDNSLDTIDDSGDNDDQYEDEEED